MSYLCPACDRNLVSNPDSWCDECQAHPENVPEPRRAPLEAAFCIGCHDHAEFYLLDGCWVSQCCTAPPMAVDLEPYE